MATNGKDTKQTVKTTRRTHFVRNVMECNLNKTVWFVGGLTMADIGAMNAMEDELIPRLGYAMVILAN